ncbi:MAG: hypothetical protein M3R27_04140 [Bacteroidota bacterium]|nr:hypothetical protein [Bacteroidota bacterium]
MKRFIKIVIRILAIILGIALLLLAVIYFGSKIASFRKSVENPVYGPKKEWVFKATFFDAYGKTIQSDTLILTTYNERFLLMQNKITWSLNKKGDDAEAVEITGIIETEKEIWIHPPRFAGYFEFTEYAPFPEVKFPILPNNQWKGSLSLGTYATKESGNQIKKEYSIHSIDTLSSIPLCREIQITGTGISGLGNYINEFTYNEIEGFTYMRYTKKNGERLIIELLGSYSTQ